MTAHRLTIAAVLVCALAAGPADVASAAWSDTGSGGAAAGARSMPTGASPTGRSSGLAVTIGWASATFADGTPVAGYVISRYDAATGDRAVVGGGCSGVVTATTCTESAVPPGSWVYTDTPVQLSWTGTPSADSRPVTTLG